MRRFMRLIERMLGRNIRTLGVGGTADYLRALLGCTDRRLSRLLWRISDPQFDRQ
jgi:hypothetical protein